MKQEVKEYINLIMYAPERTDKLAKEERYAYSDAVQDFLRGKRNDRRGDLYVQTWEICAKIASEAERMSRYHML